MCMTEEERKILHDLKNSAVTDEERRMLRKMYFALMEKQPGQKEPLIDRMSIMSRDWQRMGWAMRMLMAGAVGFVALINSWERFVNWIKGFFV